MKQIVNLEVIQREDFDYLSITYYWLLINGKTTSSEKLHPEETLRTESLRFIEYIRSEEEKGPDIPHIFILGQAHLKGCLALKERGLGTVGLDFSGHHNYNIEREYKQRDQIVRDAAFVWVRSANIEDILDSNQRVISDLYSGGLDKEFETAIQMDPRARVDYYVGELTKIYDAYLEENCRFGGAIQGFLHSS